MVRVTMILLCLLLAGAAAGRYQAEVEVRETRKEIEALEKARLDELSQIQVLRAEIAYLESPERLARIAAMVTDLAPLSGRQLLTAEDFLASFSGAPGVGPQPAPVAVDPRSARRAVAMSDLPVTE